jgi:hypothetical protein
VVTTLYPLQKAAASLIDDFVGQFLMKLGSIRWQARPDFAQAWCRLLYTMGIAGGAIRTDDLKRMVLKDR